MTYLAYIALFDTLSDAIEFENQVLSIGRQYLPLCAQNVLDGNTETPEYWTWLAGQMTTPATPDRKNEPSVRAAQTALSPSEQSTPSPTRFGLLEIE